MKRIILNESQINDLIFGKNDDNSQISPEEVSSTSDNPVDSGESQFPTYIDIAREAKPYIDSSWVDYGKYGLADIENIRGICRIIRDNVIELPQPINDSTYGNTFQSCFGLPYQDSTPDADFCGWELKTSTNKETSLFKQTFYNNATGADSPVIPSSALITTLKKNPSKSFMFTMNNKGETIYRFGNNERGINDIMKNNIKYYPRLRILGEDILLIFYKEVNGKIADKPEFSLRLRTDKIAEYAWQKMGSCVHAKSNISSDKKTIRYSDFQLMGNEEQEFKEQFIGILTQRAKIGQIGISFMGKLTFDIKTNNITLNTRYKITNSIFDRLYHIEYL